MTRSSAPERVAAPSRPGRRPGPPDASWLYLSLLWLAGSGLRLTVLAVPPLLPAIHRALHLDETLVGALTSLPVLLLAAGAVPGSMLIARLGARRALLLGLVLVAVAGAVRGAGSSAPVLFAMTFLMGVGVAVSQPSLPSLVKEWFPHRVGPATAAYSNGLLIGEIVPVAITVPLLLPLLRGSWPLSLVVWSVPVALTALAVLLLTPHTARAEGTPPARWWPDWRSTMTWRVGLVLGCASTIYFTANAFIPDYLKSIHHPGLITATLTSLNLVQLPSSILVAMMPGRLVGRRWPFIVVGALALAAVAAFVGLGGVWAVAAAGLLGFSSSMVLILNLTLPPLLADADDVHRLSAAMFTISYACSFVSSLIGGAIWDATGVPASAFTPVAVAALVMILLALGLTLPRPDSARPGRKEEVWDSPSFM